MAGWVQPFLEWHSIPPLSVSSALYKAVWITCLPGYSAKQEFVSLTTMPEAGKLRGEKHLPEDTKVSTSPVRLTGTLLFLRYTAQWPCHMGAAFPRGSHGFPPMPCSLTYSAGWESLIWKSNIWKPHGLKLFECQHGTTVEISTLWNFVLCIKSLKTILLLLGLLLNAVLLPNT